MVPSPSRIPSPTKRETTDVFALRRELKALQIENNNLHQQLIDAADHHDQQSRKTTLVVRRLEEEISDLKFLNAQYIKKIQGEQRKLDDERKRIDELFKKWTIWHGKKFNVGNLNKLPSQQMDLITGLEPVSLPTVLQMPKPIDPHIVDVVRIAETKLMELQMQVNDAQLNREDLELRIQELKSQVKTREEEIVRLSGIVESKNDHLTRPSRLEHLESQIDFLQDTINSLEQVQLLIRN
jgi:chromosome segregation ATPase